LRDKKSNTKHQQIKVDPDLGIFIRSAYGLNHPEGDFKKSYHFLRKLRPNKNVEAQLIDSTKFRMYGVHCRSKIYDGVVSKAVEAGEYVNANDALVNYMGKKTAFTTIVERRSSEWQYFVAAMREILEVDKDAVFFVAADNFEAYEGFKAEFGEERVLYTRRESYSDESRGEMELQSALTDMINLGRSMLILGSSGSSFTDVASSFGDTVGKTKVKRVGNDFGQSICVQHESGVYDIEPMRDGGLNVIDLIREDTNKKVSARARQNDIDYSDNDYERTRRRNHLEYQDRILEGLKQIWDNGDDLNMGWPAFAENNTSMFLADYSFYANFMKNKPDTLESIYLPVPWTYTQNDGQLLARIADFFSTALDKSYSHFTIMIDVNKNFVGASLKGSHAKGIDFSEIIIFGTGGTGDRIELPIGKPVYDGDWLGRVGGFDDDEPFNFEKVGGAKKVGFRGQCGHAMSCVLSRLGQADYNDFTGGESKDAASVDWSSVKPCVDFDNTDFSFNERIRNEETDILSNSHFGLVPAEELSPNSNLLCKTIQLSSIPVIIYDDSTVLDCPRFCNTKRVYNCGREMNGIVDEVAAASVESYWRSIYEGGDLVLPNGLQVQLDKKKHTITDTFVDGEGTRTYNLVADAGMAKGVRQVSLKNLDRIGGVGNHPVKRLWLPYRDIGVRWERLAVIQPAKNMRRIRKELGSMSWDEIEQRRKYLQYVKPLFTSEGMYEYIVHKLSVQHGFEILATLQYCDKFSRSSFDIGIGTESGFWYPNSARKVLVDTGILPKSKSGEEKLEAESEAEPEM